MSIREAAQDLINHYEFRKQYPAPPLDDSIEALRAALAEPQGEPVAWGMLSRGVIVDAICPEEHDREEGSYNIPLYTHPCPILP